MTHIASDAEYYAEAVAAGEMTGDEAHRRTVETMRARIVAQEEEIRRLRDGLTHWCDRYAKLLASLHALVGDEVAGFGMLGEAP